MHGCSFRNVGILALALTTSLCCARNFSDTDRQAVKSNWGSKVKFQSAPTTSSGDRWAVRLTAEGSRWLWNYNHNRGFGKTNPNTNPGPQNDLQQSYEGWISAKVAYDRWVASQEAATMNARAAGSSSDGDGSVPRVFDPGPAPAQLASLVGLDTPVFAQAVPLTQYSVTFEDGDNVVMTDQHNVSPRYAYYRFPEGVSYNGIPLKKMNPVELKFYCAKAGLTPSEQKVMQAVSMLEGGFESLNTYDTGYVSVGFIQFAALSEGGGSLGEMMLCYKASDPENYNKDLRQWGIDVDSKGILSVISPDTGDELTGTAAALEIISDKRLSAVFIHAGRKSTGYKVAQIIAAKKRFYPGNDTIKVKIGDGTLTCKVSDLIRSEAGLAILMDRKVNTGRTDPLSSVIQSAANQVGAKSPNDLLNLEALILPELVYRKNFLEDSTLSQPASQAPLSDRHGKRLGRGGNKGRA